tara:strand:+ start:671 stop:976 length:306 start_codon:yes stop_codon:yes gene_type:complete
MRYIILGAIVGIIFVLLVFGNEFIAKKEPKIKIDIPLIGMKESRIIIGNKHIHHWLIFTVILLLSLIDMGVDKRMVEVLRGFCVTMIVHGLIYADRFDFEV